MKARLMKRLTLVIGIYFIPIGIVTLGLSSPSYANEQQSEVVTDVAKTPAAIIQEVSSQTAATEIEDEKQTRWGLGMLTERDEQPLSWGVFFTEDSNGERVTEVNLGMEQLQDVIEALETDEASATETANIQLALLDEFEKLESDFGLNVNLGPSPECDSDVGPGAVVISIVAILSTFGLPFVIITLVLFYKHRKRRQRDLLISNFIDAGKDVPVEILRENSGSSTPKGNLEKGVMLTGIGIGLYLFLGLLMNWDIASVALIPLFIGLARIVIWKLGATNTTSDGAE